MNKETVVIEKSEIEARLNIFEIDRFDNLSKDEYKLTKKIIEGIKEGNDIKTNLYVKCMVNLLEDIICDNKSNKREKTIMKDLLIKLLN